MILESSEYLNESIKRCSIDINNVFDSKSPFINSDDLYVYQCPITLSRAILLIYNLEPYINIRVQELTIPRYTL